MTREIDHYELEIVVAGPVFRDTIKVEAEDPLGLEPEVVTIGEHEFQRYGDDESYDDVRADLVVARRFKTVYRELNRVTPIVAPDAVDRSVPDMVRRSLEEASRIVQRGGREEDGDTR